MLLGIFGWIVVGLLIGLVVSKVMPQQGDDPRFGIAVAAIGAILGGIAYRLYGGEPVAPFNVWSILWAAITAAAAVAIWHAVRSRFVVAGSKTVRRSY